MGIIFEGLSFCIYKSYQSQAALFYLPLPILFGKQEFHSKHHTPVRSAIRFYHVTKGLQLEINRLFAKTYQLADATAKRYCPLLSTRLLPVCRHDWGRGQIPAVAQVLVDEILK